jgi:hypothetical protein
VNPAPSTVIGYIATMRCFGVHRVSAVLLRQQLALVHDEPAGRPGAKAQRHGRNARHLEVPVRAAILGPRPVQRPAEPVVAAFQDVVEPRHRIAVIVVVGLHDVAERVDGHFVGIAEVLREHLHVRSVRIHPEDDALEVAGPRLDVGARHLGDHARAGLVGHVVAGVPLVEVVLAVGPEGDGVQPVIVVRAAPAGEQHFLLDDVVVGVLGVDDQIGGLRDEDLVAEHGDAERHADIRVLVEDLDLVRLAVLIRVFQDHDPVARGMNVGQHPRWPPVVHAFEHPDAAALVDGQIRGVGEHRLGGKQRQLEPRRRPERGQGLFGRLLPADHGHQQQTQSRNESFHGASLRPTGVTGNLSEV